MSKVRIYDLAKELKLESKKILENARRMGVDVSVPSNTLDDNIATKIREMYYPKKEQAPAIHKARMIEEEIEIRTADGASDGLLFRPEGERRSPGVIFLTDIGGIRPETRDMARRLAAEGYSVLMPNVFYRTGRPPLFDFPRRLGEERTMKRIAELSAPVTPEAMERDALDYVEFLAAQDSVSEGAMGVVGHCFTGAMAMRVAVARPDRIAAAASFHGVRLFTDAPTSPHLVLPRVKARLYFGHAINDNSMPEEAIEKFNRALEAWGGEYESEVYEDAYHGWTAPDSPVYNVTQAERAFHKLTELFAETLS